MLATGRYLRAFVLAAIFAVAAVGTIGSLLGVQVSEPVDAIVAIVGGSIGWLTAKAVSLT